jgi:hypothetical protein
MVQTVEQQLTSVREELHNWLRDSPSWLTSMIVHLVVLLMLALIALPTVTDEGPKEIAATADPDLPEIDDPPPIDPPIVLPPEATEVLGDPPPMEYEPPTLVATDDVFAYLPDPSDTTDREIEDPGLLPPVPVGPPGGGPFGPRDPNATGRGPGGPTGDSNGAVEMALKWFALHQDPRDGGWSFDHRHGACQGRCSAPGSLAEARIAATSLALLPFLGAGQTHKEGNYRKVVKAGLYFLVRNMQVAQNAGSLYEPGGRMYSHGLASIVLAEAYGMTQDKNLRGPAQAALNFITYAQDPVGGGWRYEPRTPGDTSVVGWQLMALVSGQMAYLDVSPQTVRGAGAFLDSVQTDSGAAYGYTKPGEGSASTAIGLLCRMYLGAKHDDPAIERGVARLSKQGPSPTNMYYNYYATQVMHHYEGEPWKKWNATMRDSLVEQQDKQGHQRGSWKIADPHLNRGGRLYTTALATMILEVYYRHMPIYGNKSVEQEFQID